MLRLRIRKEKGSTRSLPLSYLKAKKARNHARGSIHFTNSHSIGPSPPIKGISSNKEDLSTDDLRLNYVLLHFQLRCTYFSGRSRDPVSLIRGQRACLLLFFLSQVFLGVCGDRIACWRVDRNPFILFVLGKWGKEMESFSQWNQYPT